MTTEIYEDFPFEEIRDDIVGGKGDYFSLVSDAVAAGFTLDHIWSVTKAYDVLTYGPSHHYINVLGYICTKECHDHKTYYHYDMYEDCEDDNDLAAAEMGYDPSGYKV